jgi:hypothetical protein
MLPPRNHRRLYARSALFAGLLRCHCGRIMTPDHAHLRTGTAYYCARSKWIGTAVHGPGWVREAAILPEIRAEADRLRVPDAAGRAANAVEKGQDDPSARDSLAERKRRLAIGFADELLDEAEYREQLAAIGREVEHLDAFAEVVELPPLDWSQPPEIVNGILRALFEPIQLNANMGIVVAADGRPEILWRAPELRG